ncbi:MAG: hypothetical protein GXO07_04855 [Crenarchaeota archaeon]|nr:hypothetical protein [Thermoproteota archaeon]
MCKPKRPVKRRKVVVLHHNDFDGIMGAVSLYRLHSADDFSAKGTSRRRMLETLKDVLKKEHPEVLYVVDIGPNEEEMEKIKKLMTDKAFKLVWMDHHKWPERVLEEMRELADEVVYDRSTCGAGLAARYAKERGAKLCDCCEELVELSCDIDLWIRSDPRSEKMSLALSNERWRRYLVEKLWRCVGWDKDWEDAYSEVIGEMQKTLNDYLKKAKAGKIGDVSYILIPIRRKDVAKVSFMAEEIRREKPYDVIAFVSDVGSLHLRRSSEKVDLSELARRFSGGGHPAAAGGNLNYTLLDKMLHKLLLRPKARAFERGLKEYLESRGGRGDQGLRKA